MRQFYDSFWEECFRFLTENCSSSSAIIGPSEFADSFAEYYIYEYKELCTKPDFVIVHKGMLKDLGVSFVSGIVSNLNAQFANEVFVIFGHLKSSHRVQDRHYMPLLTALASVEISNAATKKYAGLGDLLYEGKFQELALRISKISPNSGETRKQLIELSFHAKDWRRLYSLTYDNSRDIDFDTHLLHCYAAVQLGVKDEMCISFPARIEKYQPRYNTSALRLIELASLDAIYNAALLSNPDIVAFLGRHFLAGKYDFQSVLPSSSVDPTEPIDVVYTWFDPSDPAWESARTKFTHTVDNELTGEARYGNIGEIYLSINLLVLNAPFIRNIFIVHSDQESYFRRDRLSDQANMRIVFVKHRDYMRKEVLLPTFNSDAIESCFDRIEGLSETFIYLNDDCFLGKILNKADLFVEDGRPRLLANHKIWKREDLRIRGATAADRDSRTLLCFLDKFGSPPSFSPAHQMMICHKRSFERTWEIFPYEMTNYVAQHRMRDYTSLQFLRLTLWIAERERRQSLTLVAPHKEIFRRGIVDETLTSARTDTVYFYSLNNMNNDSKVIFGKFADILLGKHSPQRDNIYPEWAC